MDALPFTIWAVFLDLTHLGNEDFQIFKLPHFQTFKHSSSQTFKLSKFDGSRPSNFQTFKVSRACDLGALDTPPQTPPERRAGPAS